MNYSETEITSMADRAADQGNYEKVLAYKWLRLVSYGVCDFELRRAF